jgi:molybdopterin-guanine dinucleotide biosynthesis protein MobB
MVDRAVATLREVVDDVVVVSARPLAASPAPVVPDRVQGAGPLGGLDAALAAASERGFDGVLLVACDLPLLTQGLLRRVAGSLGEHPAAAPQREAGGVEPLCAAYRTDLLPEVRARLEQEDRSLHSLFRAVGGHVIPSWLLAARGAAFLNVNTREDRVRAELAMTRMLPPVVCVIGKKKSGKTATTVGLIQELVTRGYRVMSAKHGHGFDLDREGTDSYRHRHQGGAHRVVMAGPEQVAVMGGWGSGGEVPLEELVARYLSDADVVVAEGFKTSGAPKIEVFRRAAHDRPLYGGNPERDATYLAVLTDVAGFEAHVPVLDVDDPARFQVLADLVEREVLG